MQKEEKNEDTSEIDLYEALKIKEFKVEDAEYRSEVPERMQNKYFPGFPSTIVSVGMPGSGKTTVTMNLLTNKNMWYGFFDEIYAYGPTCKADKQYKRIKFDEDKVCVSPKQFIPHLSKVIDAQTQKVEMDPKSAPKLLFIFEDMTSFYDKVQRAPEFQRCYTQIRHMKGTSITKVHKWKAFNRTCRVSSQHIMFWNKQFTEMDQLREDFGPPRMRKEDWYELVEYAQKPRFDGDKPFLYINTFAPMETRFRKSFNEILNLNLSSPAKTLTEKKKRGRPRKNENRENERGKSPERQSSLIDPTNGGTERDRR